MNNQNNNYIMQKTKRQHYVPEVYLKNFATKEKEKFLFYVFKLQNLKQLDKKQNIENFACESYLYDIKKEKVFNDIKKYFNFEAKIPEGYVDEKQEIEKYFSEYVESKEGLFDGVQRILNKSLKFLTGHKKFLSDEDKYKCALYIVVQNFRTPYAMEKQKESTKLALLSLANIIEKFEGNNKKSSLIRLETEESKTKANWIDIVLDQEFIKGMSNILFGIFNWYVLVAKDGQAFYTSDDPVSKLYTDHSPYGSPEFDQLIVFPLAPSVCLLLINKDLEKVINVGEIKPNEFSYVDDRWFFKCNSITVTKAKRFIFSKENNFDIVNSLIKSKKGS